MSFILSIHIKYVITRMASAAQMSAKTQFYAWFSELHAYLRASPIGNVPKMYHSAHRLVHHQRNGAIRRRPFAGYILQEGDSSARLEGITKPIQAVFYPYHKSASTGGSKTGGASRGNLTDREIQMLVNEGRMPDNGESFSKYTEMVLEYLHRHKLRPFAAQFLVYDTNLRMATELDLLCVDMARDSHVNVVNLQVKTGFDNNYDTPGGRFLSPYVPASPLKRIQKSHRTAHALQALVEHMMVQINYNRELCDTFILVVSEDVTSLYRISEELRRLEYDIYHNLYLRDDAVEMELRNILTAAAAKKLSNTVGTSLHKTIK